MRQDPLAAPPTAAELAPVLGATYRKGGKRQGPTGPPVGRVAAEVAAFDVGVYVNHCFGRETFQF
ncbi:MAG: hypothetical protein ACR2PL_26910, partial [Dehalococcoidia bacterium]